MLNEEQVVSYLDFCKILNPDGKQPTSGPSGYIKKNENKFSHIAYRHSTNSKGEDRKDINIKISLLNKKECKILTLVVKKLSRKEVKRVSKEVDELFNKGSGDSSHAPTKSFANKPAKQQSVKEHPDIEFHFFDGQVTMSSLEFAEAFNKEHRNVLADIRSMFEEMGEEEGLLKFQQSYLSEQGKLQPYYELTQKYVLMLGAQYNRKLTAKLADGFIAYNKEQPQLETTGDHLLAHTTALHNAALKFKEHETKLLQHGKTLVDHNERIEVVEVRQDFLDNHNYITFTEYCAELRLNGAVEILKKLGMKANSYCVDNGIDLKDATNGKERIGSAYPAWRWRRDVVEHIVKEYHQKMLLNYKESIKK